MNAMLVGLALAVGAPALKERPKDGPSILGNWELVEWLQSGNKMPIGDGSGVEFLPGGKRLWRDGPGQVEERSYQLGPAASPANIDLIKAEVGQVKVVYPCIYKVETDALVIAVGAPNGERPKSFEECRERGYMLMTFKRVKKKD